MNLKVKNPVKVAKATAKRGRQQKRREARREMEEAERREYAELVRRFEHAIGE